MKIKSNRFNQEQVEFIINHTKGVSTKNLQKLFNERFGTNYSIRVFQYFRNNHGLKSGLDGRFKKGHVPINKGTKGMFNVGGNRTSFKKGMTPRNAKPVGSTRIDSKDGYLLVKTKEPNVWELAHRILWEKHNGQIPPKHRLIFLNGDRLDIRLDNLKLVTYGESAVMAKKGLFSNDKDLNETGLLIAKLSIAQSKARKKHEEND